MVRNHGAGCGPARRPANPCVARTSGAPSCALFHSPVPGPGYATRYSANVPWRQRREQTLRRPANGTGQWPMANRERTKKEEGSGLLSPIGSGHQSGHFKNTDPNQPKPARVPGLSSGFKHNKTNSPPFQTQTTAQNFEKKYIKPSCRDLYRPIARMAHPDKNLTRDAYHCAIAGVVMDTAQRASEIVASPSSSDRSAFCGKVRFGEA